VPQKSPNLLFSPHSPWEGGRGDGQIPATTVYGVTILDAKSQRRLNFNIFPNKYEAQLNRRGYAILSSFALALWRLCVY